MNPDLIINKTCSLTFNYNGKTFTKDFEQLEFERKITYEHGHLIPVSIVRDCYMRCNIELKQPLDEDLIGVLTNIKETDNYNDCVLTFIIEEQVKKHNKKRINKKWLKKYGTRIYTITVPYAKYLGQDDNKVYFVALPEKKV